MIFVIAGGLLGLLLFLWMFGRSLFYFGSDDRWFGAFIGLMFCMFGTFAGAFFALIVGAFLDTQEVKVRTYELAAMQSSTGTEMNFFLFAGSFNSSWSYRYYRKEGEYLRPRELSIVDHNVLVQELDDGNPRLEIFRQEFTEDWYRWIALEDPDRDYRYLFVVPVGSVVQEFKL